MEEVVVIQQTGIEYVLLLLLPYIALLLFAVLIYRLWRGPRKDCPRCAESVKRAAQVCRYCGHDFESG
jgi:hypothetical protein